MNPVKKTRAMAVVSESWGPNPPDYIVALARACEMADSQSRIAKRLNYSPAVISQTLKNKYRGDLTAVEQSIRAALMSESVDCPAVGQEIELATCLEHQAHVKNGNRSNSFRIAMTRNCPTCPKGRLGGNHD